MSNSVSALQGKAFNGYASINEMGLRGMITLRGDLGDGSFKRAVKSVVGLAVPEIRQCVGDAEAGLAWMSPDELLVLCRHEDAADMVRSLEDALAGQHALVANVSDARAVFRIEGPSAREVVSKLAPVDMTEAGLPQGYIRRTRLAQVAAAFWSPNLDTIELICFRSQAEYVFELLSRAAMPGSELSEL